MKTLLLAGATLALLTAVNLSPVMAQAQTHSGGNSACADKHYEYQYHYGHNGHWEGQWGEGSSSPPPDSGNYVFPPPNLQVYD